MKIDLEQFDGQWFKINSKEEWEENTLSSHWHYHKKKWGTYNLMAFNEPHQFPCIGIETGISYNPDGADYQHILWIYEFDEE